MVSEDLKLFVEGFAKAVDRKYDIIFNTLDHAVQLGKSNAGEGLLAMDAMFDFLHGGAFRYDVKVEQIPSTLAAGNLDESKSPYYIGFPRSSYVNASWFSIVTTGALEDLTTLGKTDAANVIIDSRVPRIFPKILSDQMYARWMVARSQLITVNLFSSVSTSISSLVESTGQAFERIERHGGGENPGVVDLAALKETEKKT